MQKERSIILNKSLITNLMALSIIFLSFYIPMPVDKHFLSVGLFALSGAITNWLAIFMLFEKVPFLYGSGVIPARFEDFKKAIYDLIMNQFFTSVNLKKFFGNKDSKIDFNASEIISGLDMNKAFDSLEQVILESPFGNMLGMFGGVDALTPLREPFIKKMNETITDLVSEEGFKQNIIDQFVKKDHNDDIIDKVSIIVKNRLDELTPQMVKKIIQDMIRKHLGWLVVWGGVFGGLIGFVSSFIA